MNKFLIFGLGAMVLIRLITPAPLMADHINNSFQPYEMPQITNISAWYNSKPLSNQMLKGKVVLIDFWDYSCLDCLKMIPHLNHLYSQYQKDGLEIVGFHTPNFEFEKQAENVEKAIEKNRIIYPVALDNDLSTASAFRMSEHPIMYLVGKDGNVRATHIGGGNLHDLEGQIRKLLGLEPIKDREKVRSAKNTKVNNLETSDIVFGSQYVFGTSPIADLNDPVPLHNWAMGPGWKQRLGYIESESAGARIKLKFLGRKAFLVVQNPDGQEGGLTVESSQGQKNYIIISGPNRYQLFDQNDAKPETLTITSETANLKFYLFDFES